MGDKTGIDKLLEKWHNIPAGKVLTSEEQSYIVDVLLDWIINMCEG